METRAKDLQYVLDWMALQVGLDMVQGKRPA